MRVVSPYRPFVPESGHHQLLGPFDWVGALAMLRESVRRSCACETVALTDLDADVGAGPSFRYPLRQTRLMLWILDVSVQYLESDDFDQDTVFVSPDTLVVNDLRPFFAGDLTVLVRSSPKYHNRPILNAVQFWPVAAKDLLIAFYRQALAVAEALPEKVIRWGADSESLRRLLAPLEIGRRKRAGLDVYLCEAATVLQTVTTSISYHVNAKRRLTWPVPIIDFKGERKKSMPQYFAALYGEAVAS